MSVLGNLLYGQCENIFQTQNKNRFEAALKMPGRISKTYNSAHEGDITGITFCPKTGLIYTSGGDLKVKVNKIQMYG